MHTTRGINNWKKRHLSIVEMNKKKITFAERVNMNLKKKTVILHAMMLAPDKAGNLKKSLKVTNNNS